MAKQARSNLPIANSNTAGLDQVLTAARFLLLHPPVGRREPEERSSQRALPAIQPSASVPVARIIRRVTHQSAHPPPFGGDVTAHVCAAAAHQKWRRAAMTRTRPSSALRPPSHSRSRSQRRRSLTPPPPAQRQAASRPPRPPPRPPPRHRRPSPPKAPWMSRCSRLWCGPAPLLVCLAAVEPAPLPAAPAVPAGERGGRIAVLLGSCRSGMYAGWPGACTL